MRALSSWRGRLSMLGILLVVCGAILAPWIAPYAYDIQNLSATNQAPSLAHWLGTDEFGRDVLSRIIVGARTSLVVAAVTAIGVSVVVGMSLGAAAGYFGGLFDRMVTAVVDLTWSFPEVLIALIFVALIGAGLQSTMIAISIAYLAQFARLTRAQVMASRTKPMSRQRSTWVRGMATSCSGTCCPMPSRRSSWPACWPPATPSSWKPHWDFFGLGVQPPKPSWGAMMSSGTAQIFLAPGPSSARVGHCLRRGVHQPVWRRADRGAGHPQPDAGQLIWHF
jgi:peptide/nickel transport system permease protein